MKTTHMSFFVGISNDEKDKDQPPQDTDSVVELINWRGNKAKYEIT